MLLDVLQEEVSASSGDEEAEAVGQLCKALFSCQADAPGDLAFEEGENIRVTKVENDQWWVSDRGSLFRCPCSSIQGADCN